MRAKVKNSSLYPYVEDPHITAVRNLERLLTAYCKANKCTKKSVFQAVGIKKQHYYEYMHFQRTLTLEKMHRFATVFGVQMIEFFRL